MRTKVFALALAVALVASVAPGCTMPCCRIPQPGTIQASAAGHCPMPGAQPVTPPADGVAALIASVAPGCTMPRCEIPELGIMQAPAARDCPMLCAQPATPPADGVVALMSSHSLAFHPIDEVPPATATIAHISDLDHKPLTSSPPAVYLLDGAFLT
jgi:hypothetical protein